MNEHLLQCARKEHIRGARKHMTDQFNVIHRCAWNDCNSSFRGKSCGINSLHVTRHLRDIRTHQCLWDSCHQTFESHEKLAYHVSNKHRVPNEWTVQTRMHYCYEHDGWCQSEQQWVQHLKLHHLPELNNFCGLIRLDGVVVVAAHCVLSLGDSHAPLQVRFPQFDNPFDLHKHMKEHLAQLEAPPHLSVHTLTAKTCLAPKTSFGVMQKPSMACRPSVLADRQESAKRQKSWRIWERARTTIACETRPMVMMMHQVGLRRERVMRLLALRMWRYQR